MSELPPDPPDELGDGAESQGPDDGPDDDLGGNVILLPGMGGGRGSVDDRFPDEASEGLEDGGPPDGQLRPPEPHLLEGAIEALLLASDGPVREHELDRWLGLPGLEAIRDGLYTIQDRMRRGYGGIRLVQVAKGWQLRTDVRFAPWVAAMRGGRPVKLSQAALETLSIVAYRQPVTRSEVEDLRGVDCGGVLRMLCERGLVGVNGRREGPGRPLIYGTTPEFLAMFSLRDLSDLPTLRDLRELRMDDAREGVGETEDDDDDDQLAASLTDALSGSLSGANSEPVGLHAAQDLDGDDDDGSEWDDEAPEAPSAQPLRSVPRTRQTSLLPPDPGEYHDEDLDDEELDGGRSLDAEDDADA